MNDYFSYSRDKNKEELRQKALLEKEKIFVKDRKTEKAKNKPWSNKTEIKLKRKIRKEKKVITEKKRKNDPIDQKEFEELQKDFKLLKNFKKKKVRFS